MSWIDFLWPMVTGACVTMGVIHLRLGLRRRPGAAHLLFAVNALVVAVYSCLEHALTRAHSPERYLAVLRWMDIVGGGGVVASLTGFVWVFFGTGRKWLACLAPVVMAVSLIPDLLPVPRLVFLQLHGIKVLPSFGGSTFVFAEGERNPWNVVFYLAVLLVLVFVADASFSLWSRGQRRRAVLVGGSIIFFVLFAGVHSALVDAGAVPTPYLFSFAYLAILVAMGVELSDDVFRSAQLAHDLGESEERMRLAVEAANFGVWIRDLGRGEIWASEQWRALFGFEKIERLDLDGILKRVHPEDREPLRRKLAHAVELGGDYETEYRIVLPDGRMRWVSSRGRVESNGGGKPAMARGVTIDITGRRRAEQEMHLLRQEIAHVGRVSMLGQLASALAHEINQPLGAILRNAEAAEIHLQSSVPDLEEIRAIVGDIHKDDQRAVAVIERMRAFLKQRDLDTGPVNPRELIGDVVSLTRADAATRDVKLEVSVPHDLPFVRADRVHLQQVLLNLVLNAMGASGEETGNQRIITLSARRDAVQTVEIAVSDRGPGVPADQLSRIFDPFFTTKPDGMGMGLAISRTIIEAHDGRLWAENNSDGGATFRFTLPIAAEKGAA